MWCNFIMFTLEIFNFFLFVKPFETEKSYANGQSTGAYTEIKPGGPGVGKFWREARKIFFAPPGLKNAVILY